MICTKCNEDKELSNFAKASHTKTGYQSWCRTCKNKLENNWYHASEENKKKRAKQILERLRENKRKAIEYLGGKCKDCAGVFHQSVYDFHHRDPKEKEESAEKLMHKSWDKIVKEINKCDLLCSNCHRIRHNAENY